MLFMYLYLVKAGGKYFCQMRFLFRFFQTHLYLLKLGIMFAFQNLYLIAKSLYCNFTLPLSCKEMFDYLFLISTLLKLLELSKVFKFFIFGVFAALENFQRLSKNLKNFKRFMLSTLSDLKIVLLLLISQFL